MSFGITVHQLDETGRRVALAWFGRATDAPELEEIVTGLHREFPEPGFVVDVQNL